MVRTHGMVHYDTFSFELNLSCCRRVLLFFQSPLLKLFENLSKFSIQICNCLNLHLSCHIFCFPVTYFLLLLRSLYHLLSLLQPFALLCIIYACDHLKHVYLSELHYRNIQDSEFFMYIFKDTKKEDVRYSLIFFFIVLLKSS